MNSGKYLVVALLAGSGSAALVYAQGAGAPAATGQAGVRRARPRAGGFPEHTRPLAPADVLIRGKSLYGSMCASCHAADIRGVIGKGISLLRSQPARSDQHGEIIGALVAKHNPKINLVEADTVAIAEYIHSILATTGPQGSPPGRNPVGLRLNILVGDAKAGQAYFDKECASCHSIAGDLKGIATKYGDAKALQNGWVAGTLPVGGGGRGRGRGGRAGQATVTMPNGEKIQGSVVRKDDYIVILTLADGMRKSIPLDVDPAPTVEVKDPNEAHKKMVLILDDPDNKNMHDVTAFLWTLK